MELTLLLPVLLLVAVAICQVAVSLNCYLVVTAASREGARRGAETNDVEAARKAAMGASGGLPGNRPRVDVDFPEGRGKGEPIKVTVTYDMPLLIPVLDRLVPGATFHQTTLMALERSER